MEHKIIFYKLNMACTIEDEPSCGEDFCEDCGDCLSCYGDSSGDDCPHYWTTYWDDFDKYYPDDEKKQEYKQQLFKKLPLEIQRLLGEVDNRAHKRLADVIWHVACEYQHIDPEDIELRAALNNHVLGILQLGDYAVQGFNFAIPVKDGEKSK